MRLPAIVIFIMNESAQRVISQSNFENAEASRDCVPAGRRFMHERGLMPAASFRFCFYEALRRPCPTS